MGEIEGYNQQPNLSTEGKERVQEDHGEYQAKNISSISLYFCTLFISAALLTPLSALRGKILSLPTQIDEEQVLRWSFPKTECLAIPAKGLFADGDSGVSCFGVDAGGLAILDRENDQEE